MIYKNDHTHTHICILREKKPVNVIQDETWTSYKLSFWKNKKFPNGVIINAGY